MNILAKNLGLCRNQTVAKSQNFTLTRPDFGAKSFLAESLKFALRGQILLLQENLFSKEMRIAAQRTKQTANYC